MNENITGFFFYQEKHTTQQVKNIKQYFNFLLNEEKFDTIIELGTSFAGLTYILDDILKENNLPHNIHTFDNAYRDYIEVELNNRGCFYHILDESTTEYESVVINLLTKGGKTLLLCDGGNKIDEFNKYSKNLKSGDFIMAHDYSVDNEYFNEHIFNKIWNWCEITYKDIEISVLENSLNEYKKIDFSNAVWACYYKQKI